MSLPDSLTALVPEPVLAALQTGATTPFFDAESGDVTQGPVWWAITATRSWMLAESDGRVLRMAHTDVLLEKGWTWDAIRVGTFRAALRTGTRAAAEEMLALYEKQEKNGRPVDLTAPPAPTTTAEIARGAWNVPAWVSRLEAPADATWILAAPTADTWPIQRPSGEIEQATVWFLLHDQGLLAATSAGHQMRVEALTHTSRTARRDLLHVKEGVELRTNSNPQAVIDVLLAAPHTTPAQRWAMVLDLHIRWSAPEPASDLLAMAFLAGRASESWLAASELAWAAGDHDAAVQAAIHHLQNHPETDLQQVALAFTKRRLDEPEQLPSGLYQELPPFTRPSAVPWPPSGPVELWAHAASAVGRPEALELWTHRRGRSPEALAGVAAWCTDDASAAMLWLEAAQLAYRPAPERARDLLSLAIERAPEEQAGMLHWYAAAWASDIHADPTHHLLRAVASPPPDDLVQTAASWKRAAHVAEREEARDTAVLAYEKAWMIDSYDREALQDGVRLLERLDRSSDALRWLLVLEERERAVAEPSTELWRLRLQVSRLARATDNHALADDALHGAVTEGLLEADAYESACQLGADHVPEEQLQWWQHVAGALRGEAVAPPSPVHTLEQAELDALHPAGVGWLESVRQRVDVKDPPPRSDVTRGLERGSDVTCPVLIDAVSDLSQRLKMAPPDLFLFRGEGAYGMAAWPVQPPVVLVGHHHLKNDHPQALSEPARRYALAVELVHLAAQHPLLHTDDSLLGTSHSVYTTFGRYAGTAETVVDVVTLLPGIDQIAKIQTLVKLSQRVFQARSVVDKASAVVGSGRTWLGLAPETQETVGRTFEGTALQMRLQADAAALMLTGDLTVAVEAILGAEPNTAGLVPSLRKHGITRLLPRVPQGAQMRIASLVGAASRRTFTA